MKTKITSIMLMIGLFIFASVMANEPVPASLSVSKAVAKKIYKELAYPDFGKPIQLNCCVVAKVLISEEGSFKVLKSNCVNDKLKDYVVAEIEKMKDKGLEKHEGQFALVKINVKFLH